MSGAWRSPNLACVISPSALLEAQETERRNMSRVLHDELGQMITAIRLDLGLLESQKTPSSDDPALKRAMDGADQLLESVHRFASSARPSVLDDIGLEEAIARFDRRGPNAVWPAGRRGRVPGGADRASQDSRECIFGSSQEALANVVAHADAKQARVRVESDNGRLRIEVEDSGVGFDPAILNDSARLGVLGMRERTELLNGTVSTTVVARRRSPHFCRNSHWREQPRSTSRRRVSHVSIKYANTGRAGR